MELAKLENQFLIFLQKKFSSHFGMTADEAVKIKSPHTLLMLINSKIKNHIFYDDC